MLLVAMARAKPRALRVPVVGVKESKLGSAASIVAATLRLSVEEVQGFLDLTWHGLSVCSAAYRQRALRSRRLTFGP